MFGVNDTDGKRVYVDSAEFFERMTLKINSKLPNI